MRTIAYTDGATLETNPGPAGIGVVFLEDAPGDGEPILSLCMPLDEVTTNNVAEYRAVIEAIETWLMEIAGDGNTQLEIRCDSELVVQQVNGRYKVREPHLIPPRARVKELQRLAKKAGGKITVVHIPREENTLADLLSKEAATLCSIETK